MLKTVAASAKDESVRLLSSCGGIFSVLAERVLDDGGVVVGVAQTAPTRFGHVAVDNKADLAKRHQFPRQVGRLERLCVAASVQVREIRFCASWPLEIHAPVSEPHLPEYICDDCHYRKLPRIADITLGDYWGISRYHPEMNDNKGTSVVLLNTEHGKALFEAVADKVFQCDSKVEYAIAGNPCIVRSSTPHPMRAEFFANLDKYTLDQLIKMYCPFPSPLKRAYTRVRGLLGRIKRKIVG